MARVTKTILPPGVHHAPQGVLRATPERIRSWADKFRRMKAAGIRVPVCWGHQPGAIPGEGEDKARRQFALSRFNAGYLEDLQVGAGGGLDGVLDIPGAETDEEGNLLTWAQMPDGRKVRCAIKEVSAAIRDWKDGKGREWPDVIMHVALVPLPVVAGQEGFGGAELGFDFGDVPGEIHLSMSSLLHGGRELSGGGEMDEMLDAVGTGAVGAGGGVSGPLQRCLGLLAKMGLHLPEDTEESNFCERLDLIGTALERAGVLGGVKAGGGAAEPDGDEMLEAADDDLPMDDDMVEGDELPLDDDLGDELPLDEEMGDELPPEDDEMGEEMDEELADDMEPEDDGEEGVTVSGDSDGLPGDEEEEDAVEESRPLMMGTGGTRGGLVVRTRLEKQLVGQVKKGVQAQRLARLAGLQKKGLPRHRAEQIRQEILQTPVELARRKGRIVPLESRVDVELSTLESVAQGGGWVRPGTGQVKQAKRPKVGAPTKVSKKFIEEQAASVSSQRFGR